MLDAALIKDCAHPSLKPAIVEQFVTAAGSYASEEGRLAEK
ncbi:conjugal transfer protein TraH (plasmid) [Sinorhizobium americanum]|uniref:Conjugal transfer protein TraH n=1 Tax=Sinorhizobium americanum TaxID=194963 RepID=A0A1L3LT15_9HYPH|nr:conjugal transfer protein TraH [Sinorhizobium americanum]